MKLPELLELMSAFDRSNLTSVLFETEDAKIKLEKASLCSASAPAAPLTVAASSAAPAATPAAETTPIQTTVTAPIVGVVYCASAPGKPPYIRVGQTVKPGDVLCLIEAMKTINEVKAPCSGVVREILFTDAELKEFGSPLVVIGD